MLRNFIRCCVRVFLFFVFRIKVTGAENLISDEGLIVAVNHRSNWDPVIIGAVSKRKLRFMAKSELFKNKFCGWFLKVIGAFPIERGKGDIGALKNSIKILQDGEALLIFPEGTRVRDESESKAKTGAVMIASHAKVKILPVYISGSFKWMSKITVSYGKPIDVLEGVEGRMTKEQMQEAADNVLLSIKQLKV